MRVLFIFIVWFFIALPCKAAEIKNIIWYIPDGFSTSHETAYFHFKGEPTVFQKMKTGSMRTYSASSKVTDSAAAATALATGMKTTNGFIGMLSDGTKLENVMEKAQKRGMATGLVATVRLSHATPAGFSSHVPNRKSYEDITKQLVHHQFDILLGGGTHYFQPYEKEMKKLGYQWITNWDDTQHLTDKRIIGTFAEKDLTPIINRKESKEPTLLQMTELILKQVDKKEKPFIVMIEGSQIDWASHQNDPAYAMKEIEDFEQAVELGIQYANEHEGTLVLVTPDHETGGMSLEHVDRTIIHGFQCSLRCTSEALAIHTDDEHILKKQTSIPWSEADKKRIHTSNKVEIESLLRNRTSMYTGLVWSTTGHTGGNVPIYSYGAGSKYFQRILDNTEIITIIENLW